MGAELRLWCEPSSQEHQRDRPHRSGHNGVPFVPHGAHASSCVTEAPSVDGCKNGRGDRRRCIDPLAGAVSQRLRSSSNRRRCHQRRCHTGRSESLETARRRPWGGDHMQAVRHPVRSGDRDLAHRRGRRILSGRDVLDVRVVLRRRRRLRSRLLQRSHISADCRWRCRRRAGRRQTQGRALRSRIVERTIPLDRRKLSSIAARVLLPTAMGHSRRRRVVPHRGFVTAQNLWLRLGYTTGRSRDRSDDRSRSGTGTHQGCDTLQ